MRLLIQRFINRLQVKEKDDFIAHYLLFSVFLLKGKRSSLRLTVNLINYLLGWIYFKIVLKSISLLNKFRETYLFFKIRNVFVKNSDIAHKYVFIPLPANYKYLNLKNIFHVHTHFKLPKLTKKRYKSSFLFISESYGILFKSFCLKWKSFHGLWDYRSVKEIHPYYYRYIFELYLRKKYLEKNIISLPKNNKNYILVHHGFNYYHWLTETWARLWEIKGSEEKYIAILPESLKQYEFVTASLQTIDTLEVYWVEESTILHIPELVVVSMKRYWQHYNPTVLVQLREYFQKHASIYFASIHSPEKIFISRKKAARRTFDNNELTEQLFKENGFSIVHFEDYTFLEQVALMRNTRYLAGMHGAGLTNMLFMPNRGNVLEFHREVENYPKDHYSIVYKNMSACLEHEYSIQFCEPTDKNESFFTVNYKVNLKYLEATLQSFLR